VRGLSRFDPHSRCYCREETGNKGHSWIWQENAKSSKPITSKVKGFFCLFVCFPATHTIQEFVNLKSTFLLKQTEKSNHTVQDRQDSSLGQSSKFILLLCPDRVPKSLTRC